MTTRIRKSVSALTAHDLGSLTRKEIRDLVSATIPVGMCFVWNGTANDVPDGYTVCNGLGGRTPNLTNRTPIGAGGNFPLNSTGGKYNFDLIIDGKTDGHALTTKEIPPHTHGYQSNVLFDSERTGKKSRDAANKQVSTYKTSKELGNPVTGAADPHDHGFSARFVHEAIAPYITKYWIMRTAGSDEGDEALPNFSLSARTRVTKRLAELTAADCDMYTEAEINNLARSLLPAGCIAPWWGDVRDVPKGWRVLDGTGGRADFRDRMVVGAGGNYELHSIGGTIDVRYQKTDVVTSTEMFRRHLPPHDHKYQTQFTSAGVRVESDHGNWTSVPEHSARFRPTNYNTANADTDGALWGNVLGGVDPHTHPYTITYIHKCMTPFWALHWLIKVEGD
ncbi:structural protein [Pseudomonas phage Achelous]|uniref:Structural protein n=1 Tax=Pseudomonas phage Achelous TaxID=2163982 RepID=A0A2S1GMV5_9CAUD|nr:tail protein [Pseudomonas phage Achelous]AWD90717.1 structural protein [Pseudomonas phage Achelous]